MHYFAIDVGVASVSMTEEYLMDGGADSVMDRWLEVSAFSQLFTVSRPAGCGVWLAVVDRPSAGVATVAVHELLTGPRTRVS